ncbi:MAG: hypothetical protein KF890_15590, partial [Nitrospira sp.]|nr:hypothetical protein [Nitrospira sp.]
VMKKRPLSFERVARKLTDYTSPTFDSVERLAESYAEFTDRYITTTDNLARACGKHFASRLSIAAPPVLGSQLVRLSPREGKELIDQTIDSCGHMLRDGLLRQGFKPVRACLQTHLL